MDPSQEFAQAVLDQLRRDVKRFARGRAAELDRVLGRSPQYFRRATVRSLKLHETFAAIRFLGYSPLEYVARICEVRNLTVPDAVGYFKRRAPASDDGVKLRGLEEFSLWIDSVWVDDSAKARCVDAEAILVALGLHPDPVEILETAKWLFAVFSRQRPEPIHPQTALTLGLSIARIGEVLTNLDHLKSACLVLDVGFRLDQNLENMALRSRLFQVGAELSLRLGFEADATWCLREASEAALWAAQADTAARLYRSYLEGASQGLSADTAGPLDIGRLDAKQSLAVSLGDRRHFGAARLDKKLGAGRAFSKAQRNLVPMSLERWFRLVQVLGESPYRHLRRSAVTADLTASTTRLLPGLASHLAQSRDLGFQQALATWSAQVSVDAGTVPMGFFDLAELQGHPNTVFISAVESVRYFLEAAPNSLHPSEIPSLCDALLKIGWVLRRRARLRSAAEVHDAAFCLLGHIPSSPQNALAFRSAAHLAVDLGALDEAGMFFRRAQDLDLQFRDEEGLKKSMVGIGLCAHLIGNFQLAVQARRVALKLGSEDDSLDSMILFSLADTYLHMGRVDDAVGSLSRMPTEHWPDEMNRASYLIVRGECRSSMRDERGAQIDFTEAEELIGNQRPRDLLLLGLRVYNHLRRFGRTAEAHMKALELIGLAARSDLNPSSRRAVEELIRSTFDGSKISSTEIQALIKRIRYPNL